MASDSSAIKTYKGSCHCGKFAYEFKHTSLEAHEFRATICNCSICSKKGNVYSVLMDPSEITWKSGDLASLTEYTFNSKTCHHYFCPVDGCAIGVLMDENNPFVKNKITLNLNCVEGVDTEKLNKKIFDGKSH